MIDSNGREKEIKRFEMRYAVEQALGPFDWRDYATVDIKNMTCKIDYPPMPINSDPEMNDAIADEMNFRAWKSLKETVRFIESTKSNTKND